MFPIAGQTNGWTDWDEIFCGHSWVAGGDKGKIINFFFRDFFFKFFFSTGNVGPFS